MSIRTMVSNGVEAVSASLALWAEERRTGIDLVQAVALEQGKTELIALGGPDLAAEAQRMAVELVKSGVTEGDLEGLICRWAKDQYVNNNEESN